MVQLNSRSVSKMRKKWWKESVVYQIYPKSFKDSNGDGVGDIRGIIQKLDYLSFLGIDVIWLSPVYQSPMKDGGYDISDYYKVDEMFGSNEDLEELISKAKEHGIKILMDLVINHTSSEHKWFKAAMADKNSKYRDYYYFREGVNNRPPNNWRSYFGGSVWEKVPTEENMYYLHLFEKNQPDLNYENPDVRKEIYSMIEWWLKKGIAGFRIDAILNIKKQIEFAEFPNDAPDGTVFVGPWVLNQPGIEVWLKEMKVNLYDKYDAMTVAEADVQAERLVEYIGDEGYFSMVFDFSYADIDVPASGEWFIPTNWTWEQLIHHIHDSQLSTQESGWGAVYLENHDQPRSVNKYLPEAHIHSTSKKMLATLFLMLRGTPFIYQGQELGMTNNPLGNIDLYDDVATHNHYKRGIEAGHTEEESLQFVSKRSRDNTRMPMQWNNARNAGFSEAENPWLPVKPNYLEINVEDSIVDSKSVLNYYRELIRLRKESDYSDLIIYGDYQVEYTDVPDILAYSRNKADKALLILVNPNNHEVNLDTTPQLSKRVIGNYADVAIEHNQLILRPYESVVFSNE